MMYQRSIVGFGFHLEEFIYPIEDQEEHMWCRTELIPESNYLREHIHIQALGIYIYNNDYQIDSRLCYLYYLN